MKEHEDKEWVAAGRLDDERLWEQFAWEVFVEIDHAEQMSAVRQSGRLFLPIPEN
ncbi:hypothetical protein [Paraburkholderia mimosarum]|uniref:hypothetical protein n=1 Tax=Paraburkholderia mimosarum TaxID=312026 RepID=UPI000410593F|nr:hypothetical protein [Paraburkholderia mimosarum]